MQRKGTRQLRESIVFALTLIGLVLALSWAMGAQTPAVCSQNCPHGHQCRTDIGCAQHRCNLSCVQLDKFGYDKRCL